MTRFNRRQFISNAGAAGLAAGGFGASLAGLQSAQAADTSGYKALVCLFFLGGMDHSDSIIPFDQRSYNALSNIRNELFQAHGVGSGNSSRDRQNLLPLNPDNPTNFGSRRYAMPQELSGLRSMFNDGDLAVIGGVGPLVEPVTRETFENETALLPPNLFSHNDQQSVWQTFGPEGTIFGWGGLFADAALRADPGSDARFVPVTTSENAVFLSGQTAPSFNVSPSGMLGLDVINRKYFLGFGNNLDATRTSMNRYYERQIFAANNVFQRDYGKKQGENIRSANAFSELFENANVPDIFPNTRIGQQLRAIARTISIRGSLDVSRQVFYASIGGFDTHSDQASRLPLLHTQISEAMTAFRTVMTDLNLWENVTVFTAADFGRTLGDNGDGTDHGWGGHHFVAGGAVRGKNIYGNMPTTDLDGDEYTPSRGRLIPSVSVDQYAATLGSWFGLSSSELNSALPNLNNFNVQNLGFMETQAPQLASITKRVPSTQSTIAQSKPEQSEITRVDSVQSVDIDTPTPILRRRPTGTRRSRGNKIQGIIRLEDQ